MAGRWLFVVTGGLAVLAVGLGIALAVAVAADNDTPPGTASGAYGPGCGMVWGMMAGPGSWDPESMRAYMQRTLGTDGYNAMVAHMRSHLDGDPADDAGFDASWHSMMDGMMRGWSRADWERCCGWMTDD